MSSQFSKLNLSLNTLEQIAIAYRAGVGPLFVAKQLRLKPITVIREYVRLDGCTV